MHEETSRAQRHAWDDELASRDRVEIGLRRGRPAFWAVLCLTITTVIVVAMVATHSTGSMIGWVNVLIFGGCGGALAWCVLRRGPAAVITSRDVASPMHHWSAPWEAVRGAVALSSGATYVIVEPDWHAAWRREQGLLKRLSARLSRTFHRVEAFSFPGYLDVEDDVFAAWITERARSFRHGRAQQ